MNVHDYTIYEYATGQVVKSGSAQIQVLLGIPLLEGEALILGDMDPDLEYVYQGRRTDRPVLSDVSISGSSFSFTTPLPESTEIVIESAFISNTITATGQNYVLAFPEAAQVTVKGPWPYRDMSFVLTADESTPAEGAVVIALDLDRMKQYFVDTVTRNGQELVVEALGNPSPDVIARWQTKRSIRNRFLSEVNTPADDVAMNAAIRYSGITVAEELARIGAWVDFEDWLVLRADSLKTEAEKRLMTANTVPAVLTVVTWAESEVAIIVSEAQQRAPSLPI